MVCSQHDVVIIAGLGWYVANRKLDSGDTEMSKLNANEILEIARQHQISDELSDAEVVADLIAVVEQLQKRASTITHCENCGGDWVDNGLQTDCFCKRVAELEEMLFQCQHCELKNETLSRKDGD